MENTLECLTTDEWHCYERRIRALYKQAKNGWRGVDRSIRLCMENMKNIRKQRDQEFSAATNILRLLKKELEAQERLGHLKPEKRYPQREQLEKV
jgi:hypothetical protein